MSRIHILYVAASNDCILGIEKPKIGEGVAALLTVFESHYDDLRFRIAEIALKHFDLDPGVVNTTQFRLSLPNGKLAGNYTLSFWIAETEEELIKKDSRLLQTKKLESYLTSQHPGIRILAKAYL